MDKIKKKADKMLRDYIYSHCGRPLGNDDIEELLVMAMTEQSKTDEELFIKWLDKRLRQLHHNLKDGHPMVVNDIIMDYHVMMEENR